MRNLTGPGKGEEPPFRAPWEAQVFALVCALQDSGELRPGEWSARLGEEIRLAGLRGDPDLGDTYYAHCLAALEKWLIESNRANHGEVSEYLAGWRDAYRKTPHGLDSPQGSGG